MQSNQYTCQNIEHQGMEIQGFCLSQKCSNTKPQFCINCALDDKIHKNCKNECKSFSKIQDIVKNAIKKVSDLLLSLNNSYAEIKQKYTEHSKELETKTQFLKRISNSIESKQYSDIINNINTVKEWHQFIGDSNNFMQNKISRELMSIDQFQKSLKIQKFDDVQPKSFQSQFDLDLQKGIDLLNQKEWQKANEKFDEKIQEITKQKLVFTFYRSLALIELNQVGLAIRLRDKLKRMQNESYDYIDQISKNLLLKNESDVTALISKVYVLQNNNRLSEALDYCEIALIADNINLHAIYRKSVLLIDLKKYQDAIQTIDCVLKINKKYSCAYNVKGIALQILKRYEEALASFNQSILLDPKFSQGYYNKGMTLNYLKCYDDAISNYDLSINLEPKNAIIYESKGQALEKLQQYEKAITCYNHCIFLQPNNPEFYLQKGTALSAFKNLSDAIQCCDKAISLDPKNVYYYTMKGAILADSKEYDEAFIQIDKALKLNPQYQDAINLKNNILQEMRSQSNNEKQTTDVVALADLLKKILGEK